MDDITYLSLKELKKITFVEDFLKHLKLHFKLISWSAYKSFDGYEACPADEIANHLYKHSNFYWIIVNHEQSGDFGIFLDTTTMSVQLKMSDTLRNRFVDGAFELSVKLHYPTLNLSRKYGL